MNLNNRLINQQQKKIVLIILPPLSSLSIFKLLLFVQNSFQSNHMAQLTIRFMSSVLFLSTDLDFFFFCQFIPVFLNIFFLPHSCNKILSTKDEFYWPSFFASNEKFSFFSPFSVIYLILVYCIDVVNTIQYYLH